MSQNREWMYRRLLPNGSLNPDFVAGLEYFIRVAIANPDLMDGKKIKCPCKKCNNMPYMDTNTVKNHIAENGFVKDYEIWRFQGETSTSTSTSLPVAKDKNLDNAEASSMVIDHAGIGTGSQFNTNNDTEKPPNREAHRELWPGCKTHSQLSFTASLMSWKAEHNISDESFDEMLGLVKEFAPKDNLVPSNFSETKKLLRGVGLPIKKMED